MARNKQTDDTQPVEPVEPVEPVKAVEAVEPAPAPESNLEARLAEVERKINRIYQRVLEKLKI